MRYEEQMIDALLAPSADDLPIPRSCPPSLLRLASLQPLFPPSLSPFLAERVHALPTRLSKVSVSFSL